MEMNLSFISDSMDVGIKNYSERKFEYDKWIVSDKFVLNEKQPHLSKYSIVVTSPNIGTEKELNDYRINGEKVVNRITHFIPFCGLPTLNSPKSMSSCRDVSYIDYQKAPKGWEMNYNEMIEIFRAPQKTKHTFTFSVEGFRPYSIMDSSPLGDLNTLMNNYDLLGEEIKFLIFLNNAILTSTDSNVYMLIGKALEIINAIYPLKGKKDNRIYDYFPELEDVCEGYTIKDLMGLCNNRKETRHYIKNKTQLIPHDSLSKEEGLLLFKFSKNLILNVVRDKVGLAHVAIIHK